MRQVLLVNSKSNPYHSAVIVFCLAMSPLVLAWTNSPASEYKIYAGSTHAHTAYTWSHGEQFAKGCKGIMTFSRKSPDAAVPTWSGGDPKGKSPCPAILVIYGSQYPGPQVALKPDWEEVQGVPARHFSKAKENGYDFYVSSDHSQEAVFQPISPDNPDWIATKKQAAEATDQNFVVLAGFEYSENDGPGGQGHINVINSVEMRNALAAGNDLPTLYKWLEQAQANGDGPVVASFNHPGAAQYNNWAYRDPRVTDIITMLEVINSNNKIHYEGFLQALEHGWKVSPACGNDNHGLTGIARNTSRTFVLARSKTKAAILEAMKNRRTYASLDKNLQCRYSVNGAVMGSTLKNAGDLRFDIQVSDPDTNSAKDKITKIDIVKDGGAIAETYSPHASYEVQWTPTIHDNKSKYFFVRVWTAGGGDAPDADPSKPVAWLAPVWAER